MSHVPSFIREINRINTIRWIAQHNYGMEHESWRSKMVFKEMVEKTGVPMPEVYQFSETLDGLVEPTQDKWVLKPCRGAANRGVFPIIRKGGKWFNLFEKKHMSWLDIVKACKKSNLTKPPYLIEQFIGGGDIPYNWEVYGFYGEVGLIRQRENIDRKIKLYKFWDTDWQDMGLIDKTKKGILKPELPMPQNPELMLKVAKQISGGIPYSFARIDLFEHQKQVYFGELTTHPGLHSNEFKPEIDKKLGRMWLKAEARRC